MDSVGADYQYVDHCIRWHDIDIPSWKKYLSWIVSAIFFPNRKKYDLFISSGQHYMPVFMKRMKLLRKDQKVVCYQGNETLFFLKAGRYSKITAKALQWQLKQYDAHICLSKLQAKLLQEAVGKDVTYYCNFNGVEPHKLAYLKSVEPSLSGFHLLFIGNLYVGWRMWYKGIDLLLDVFQKISKEFPEACLTVVGQVGDKLLDELYENYPKNVFQNIRFVGKVDDLSPYIAQASVYLHLARGEAFGSAVIEAMAGGLIPIVSEWTGAKEVVEKIDNIELVVPLDVDAACRKVKEVWLTPIEEKKRISAACRELILKEYTIDKAVVRFEEIVQALKAI